MFRLKLLRRLSVAALTCSVIAPFALSTSSSATVRKHAASSNFAITLGVVEPFSGASGFIGAHVTAQVYSAVDEINKEGGVLGHQIVVTPVDTKGDPADALPAVAQFIATASHLFFIHGPGSDSGPELAPVINNDKIVMMSPAGQSEFDKTKLKFFWRAVAPDAANGIAMAIFAKRHHWTRVATVFGSDQGSQGDLPGIVEGIKSLGLKQVSILNISADQPSYQSEVARLLATKPQVIFTETDPTTAATFFGELTQQHSAVLPIISTQGGVIQTYMAPFRAAVGAKLFAKEYYAISNAGAKANPATAVFQASLLATGPAGQVPDPAKYLTSPNTAIGYAQVVLVALAATAAHSVSGPVFNNFIAAIANPGKGKTIVYTYAAGVKALAQHKKIEYIGPAGPYKFNQFHNSYGGQVAEGVTVGGTYVIKGTISSKEIQAH